MGVHQHVAQRQQLLMLMKVRMHCEICGQEVLITETGDLVYTCSFPCPAKILDQLAQQRNKIIRHECPKCRERDVGVNASDYYECRSCHTQFTTAGSEDWKKTYLINEKKIDDGFEAIIPVRIMPARGKGDFPNDEWVEKRIKKVESAKKKLVFMLRSMRRWLGSEDVYFDGYDFTPSLGQLAHGLLTKHKILY